MNKNGRHLFESHHVNSSNAWGDLPDSQVQLQQFQKDAPSLLGGLPEGPRGAFLCRIFFPFCGIFVFDFSTGFSVFLLVDFFLGGFEGLFWVQKWCCEGVAAWLYRWNPMVEQKAANEMKALDGVGISAQRHARNCTMMRFRNRVISTSQLSLDCHHLKENSQSSSWKLSKPKLFSQEKTKTMAGALHVASETADSYHWNIARSEFPFPRFEAWLD